MDLPTADWDEIRKTIEEARAIAEQITLVVVANIKPQQAVEGDYASSSVTTEYLSQNEASQIVRGFGDNGFYTKFYEGELGLISASLSSEFTQLPRQKKLVYSIAQSGTGIGRKSLVPAFCRLQQIPICNSDTYVLSLARHKFHVYCILKSLGIPVADSWLYEAGSGWLMGAKPPTGVTLIAKACFESASIGLTAESVGTLSDSYESMLDGKSQDLRQPIIVQRLIEGYEVEVPVISIRNRPMVLDPVSITLSGQANLGNAILDYEIVEDDGYGFSRSDHLGPPVIQALRRAAAQTFTALGISNVGRIDFRISAQDNAIYVTDVATSPHLIEHSSFNFSFSRAGMDHVDLMGAIVGSNACRLGWI